MDELLEDEQLLDTVYEAQGEPIRRVVAVVGCKHRRKPINLKDLVILKQVLGDGRTAFAFGGRV